MKQKVGWWRRLKMKLWRFWDGIRYASGRGFWHCTTCPHCEREIEIEIE